MALTPQLQATADEIEKKFSSQKGIFTIGDVAALTGTSIRDGKEILDSLMEKYDCRLKVTDQGDLIYDFGTSPHRRGERTWGEWWRGFQKTLWNAFVYFFKIWITVVLVVYFIVFLVILIAIIIGLMTANSKDDNSSSGKDSSGLFRLIGDMFYAIFRWNTINSYNSYDYRYDNRGYNYRTYESTQSVFSKVTKKKNKGFIASVYDFVFGPPRVEISPLANQQEVAAYLRTKKGVIVTPELIGLAGWDNKQAQDFFSECVARFDGEAAISENAVLYGDFEKLIRTKDSSNDGKIVWYWDEYEPEYLLTGNSFWRNAGVVGMNLFNLISSAVLLNVALSEFKKPGTGVPVYAEGLTMFLLGWFPLAFSAIFFTVPIIRYFNILPKRNKRNYENARKRIMKVIFMNRRNAISATQLLNAVNAEGNKESKLSESTLNTIMKNLVYDLDGEVSMGADGKLLYTFDQFNRVMDEAEALRKKREDGKNLGNIIFDSKDYSEN